MTSPRFRCLFLGSLACLVGFPIGCQLTAPESLTGILGDNDPSKWPAMGEVDHWTPSVTSLAYSPDGEQLVVGNSTRLQGHYDGSRVSPAGFSAPAIYSLWLPYNEMINATFYKRHGYITPGGSQTNVTMSRDGAVFAAVHDKGIEFHDAVDGTLKKHLEPPSDARLWGVVASDCRSVAWLTDAEDKHDSVSIMIQDVNTENIIATFALEGSGARVKALSPDGRFLAIAVSGDVLSGSEYHAEWSLHILDLERRSVVQKIPKLAPSVRSNIRFSPDSSMIAVATMKAGEEDREDCKLSIWSVQTGGLIGSWSFHDKMIWDFTFSADGSMIAAGLEVESEGEGKEHGEVQVWDVRTRTQRAQWDVKNDWEGRAPIWGVTALAFKPDGTTLAVGASNGAILFYQVPNGTPESTIAEKSQDATVRGIR